MQFSNRAIRVSIFSQAFTRILLALVIVFVNGYAASSATFRYRSGTTETTYTKDETTRDGITYDGTFVNSVFDPFAQIARQFFGLFSVTDGLLGEAVTVAAVQTRPIDRTSLGEEGIARTEYLANLQDVDLIPGAITFPPGLSKFDFKFVPAPIAGTPTILAQGWSVEKVSEPGVIVAISFLGFGLLLMRQYYPDKK